MLTWMNFISTMFPMVIAAIGHIKAQSGKTTEQIIADAGIRLDENDQKLLEDLIRLGVLDAPTAKASRQAIQAVPSFSYADGKVASDDGWSYDIKEAFLSQLNAQPQYRGLTDVDIVSKVPAGAYFVTNMATGLADDDYRKKHGVAEGGWPVQSDFGAWLEDNRQAIWNDAAGWFTE